MSLCRNCGAEVEEGSAFCRKCGSSVSTSIVPADTSKKTIEVQPPAPAQWYVTYATGQRGGPFSADVIRSMIARQEIKITDAVILEGGTSWVPLTQSPFAKDIAARTTVDRLAASTCPRCGAAMAIVAKSSTMATILILLGIISSIFLIGVVLIIIGVIMRRKVKVAYQCPRCNYKS